jgi:hypothetical protein
MEITLYGVRVRGPIMGYVIFLLSFKAAIIMVVTDANLDQGFPASFGVFQNYYSQLPQFAHNPYLSVVGTVASGLGYLGAPVATSVMKRYAKYQRQMIWFGCITTY